MEIPDHRNTFVSIKVRLRANLRGGGRWRKRRILFCIQAGKSVATCLTKGEISTLFFYGWR